MSLTPATQTWWITYTDNEYPTARAVGMWDEAGDPHYWGAAFRPQWVNAASDERPFDLIADHARHDTTEINEKHIAATRAPTITPSAQLWWGVWESDDTWYAEAILGFDDDLRPYSFDREDRTSTLEHPHAIIADANRNSPDLAEGIRAAITHARGET